MSENHKRVLTNGFLLIFLLMLAGCSSLGHRKLIPDRFNYNEAIGKSANEQMLLNLVRLRYQEVPVFLTVGSVLTQYIFSGAVGVNGSAGLVGGSTLSSVGGSGELIYIERPTVTYAPLSGDEFARQLLTPIPDELLFSLTQAGWSPERLLYMSLERLNRLENLPFDRDPGPDDLERALDFQRAVQLFVELGKRRAIEVHRKPVDPSDEKTDTFLIFEDRTDPETNAQVEELRELMGLRQDRSTFRITDRVMHSNEDEITIRVRSLLALMGFLSRGVEVPAEHIDESRVSGTGIPADVKARFPLKPLHISSVTERPADAFVAVEYQGYWFYISQRDQTSKETFALLNYLYQMKAPSAPTQAPVLTVPTG